MIMWQYVLPITSDEIYHHGIRGQKWGVRNGPPYPLTVSAHSSAERRAGWRKSLDASDKAGSGMRHTKKSHLDKVRVKYAVIGDSGTSKSIVSSDAKTVSKKHGFALKSKSTAVSDDIKQCNPDWYDHQDDIRWQNNCIHTVVAFCARRRGLDVVANPITKNQAEHGGMSVDDMCHQYFKGEFSLENGRYKIAKFYSVIGTLTGYDDLTRNGRHYEKKASKELGKSYRDAPDGAYGIASMQTTGGGHVFVWYKEDGVIKFADSQGGVNARLDFINIAKFGYPRSIGYVRLDDREFNEDNIHKAIAPASRFELKHGIPTGQALYHHGILGQKWGVRNGPPYPLGARNHSASEKKAGWRKSLDEPSGHNQTKSGKIKKHQVLKVLSKPNESSELHQDPASPVAELFAKFIPSVADNLKNITDYTIKNKDGQKIGEFSTEKRNHGEEMNFMWMGIREKYGGKGHAQSAMRLAIEDARKQGVKYITLEVPDISPNARHIYQKLGFKAVDKITDEDDVWGGLTSMRLDLELRHHGILGQKWGVRNGPPYPLGARNHSASEKKAGWRKSLDRPAGNLYNKGGKSKQTKLKPMRTGLTEGQKKALKTGAMVAITALAAYGAYKSGYLDQYRSVGEKYASRVLNGIGSQHVSAFDGFTPPHYTPKSSPPPSPPPPPPPPKPKHQPIIRDPKTGFKMVKESTADSLKNANPLHGTDGGDNNCTFCTIAGFLRTAGYDVTAKGTGGKAQNLGGVLEDCFKGIKVIDGSAIKFGKSPEDAAEMLKKRFGDNASGAVGIDWKGGKDGHAFSWVIKDGVVRFLDFQQNNDDVSVRHYWNLIDPNGSLVLARLDGLEINLDNIDKYVDGR